MRARMTLACVMGASWLAAVPAQAAGGLQCTTDDASFKLDMLADVSRSVAPRVFSVQGKLDARLKGQQEWHSFDLASKLAQSWVQGNDLRLQFYVETTALGDFNAIEFVVVTQRKDGQAAFAGHYQAWLYPKDFVGQPVMVRGQAQCELD